MAFVIVVSPVASLVYHFPPELNDSGTDNGMHLQGALYTPVSTTNHSSPRFYYYSPAELLIQAGARNKQTNNKR